MRRRVLEPESQGGLNSITRISVDIPIENGATYNLRFGDKNGTEFQLTPGDFPFRFEPTPPNYFTSPYLSVSSRYSEPLDPGNLNGKSVDIYYFCKNSSIFTGWELWDMTINGSTVYEDDPDFPHIYTYNDDAYYRFYITLPVGFNGENIMRCYMMFDIHVEDDILHGSRIYISL